MPGGTYTIYAKSHSQPYFQEVINIVAAESWREVLVKYYGKNITLALLKQISRDIYWKKEINQKAIQVLLSRMKWNMKCIASVISRFFWYESRLLEKFSFGVAYFIGIAKCKSIQFSNALQIADQLIIYIL